jgi:hypothetical protein
VHRYIKPLLDARILVESHDVKRNQVWRSVEVLGALDRFAVERTHVERMTVEPRNLAAIGGPRTAERLVAYLERRTPWDS